MVFPGEEKGNHNPSPRYGTPLVKVTGLTRSFQEVTAVAGLDLDLLPGEIFGLIGPDGAGKTTTLRVLSGVLPPTSGMVEVLGVDVARRPEAIKGRIGYMPQRFGLYEDLTVLENLRFYADLFLVPRRKWVKLLPEVLEFSGLGAFQDRLAGKLSGGMKQKLGLACVLIHSPEILFLDEPTNGVDPISRRGFWKMLYQVSGEGVAILIATAYLDEAERCHRVGLMDRGVFLAKDSPEDLKASYPGQVVEIRGGEIPALREVLAKAGYREAVAFGDRLHLRVEDAERESPAINRLLHEAGLKDSVVEVVEPSLEDVFIAQMRG